MKKLINIACLLMIVAFTIIPFIPQPVQAVTNWYSTNWTYRKTLTITGTTLGYQTNYPMKVNVMYGQGTDNATHIYCDSKCNTDFSDLIFTTSNGTYKLPHWIESYTASTSALVWINVDAIAANPSTTVLYRYYGNASATSTSNGTTTFTIFDDFERSTNGTAIGGSWTQVVAGATIDTAHAYSGTRSARFAPNADYTIAGLAITTNTTAINMRLWKENATGNMNLYRGNGVNLQYTWATNAEDIYNNSADTTKNTVADTWRQWIFTNYDWIAAKSDIWEGGVNVVTSGILAVNNTNNGTFKLLNGDATADHDFFVDDFFVRNCVPTEPTFTAWGTEEAFSSILAIQDVKVFEGFKATDDWLITIRYLNTYPPYYDTYDIKQYFVFRLLDTMGNERARTSLPRWGNSIGCIYLSPTLTSTLASGTAYTIQIYGTFSGNPYITYTLVGTDWVGTDLTRLDSWCKSSAGVMGTYYSTVFTTYISTKGEVLNSDGSAIFNNGIPGLMLVRPGLFNIASSQQSYTQGTFTQTNRSNDWQTFWGTKAVPVFNDMGNVINVDGRTFGALIGIVIMAIIAAVAFTQGHSVAGNIVVLPILILLGISNLLDRALIAVLFLIATGLLIKQTVIDKGAS